MSTDFQINDQKAIGVASLAPHLALVLRFGQAAEGHCDKAYLQTGRTRVFAEQRVRRLQRMIDYGELGI